MARRPLNPIARGCNIRADTAARAVGHQRLTTVLLTTRLRNGVNRKSTNFRVNLTQNDKKAPPTLNPRKGKTNAGNVEGDLMVPVSGGPGSGYPSPPTKTPTLADLQFNRSKG